MDSYQETEMQTRLMPSISGVCEMCGMMATLREYQMKQMRKDLNSSPLENWRSTGKPSYYVDEDYPAGPEIQ